MVREIKNAGHANVEEAREAVVQRMLHEKVLILTMTHNIELATKMSRREYHELEKVQSKALKLLYSMPQSASCIATHAVQLMQCNPSSATHAVQPIQCNPYSANHAVQPMHKMK